MKARLIDGAAEAVRVKERVRQAASRFHELTARPPGLAVVLVGDDPASRVYVRSKGRQATANGLRSFEFALPADTEEDDLLRLIGRLNVDDQVDGILVQLPLPPQIDRWRVLEAIDPRKDVDGFHPYNAGRLAVGRPAFSPCTPLGVMHLVRTAISDLRGVDAVVIGRSNIVGKPLGLLLADAGCTVTAIQLETRAAAAICRRADLVVVAAGHPNLVRADWIKPGATVIDVGINRIAAPGEDGRSVLAGDVAFEEVAGLAGALTPVPGGVGPMTVAYLLSNTVDAAFGSTSFVSASEARRRVHPE